MGFGRCNSKKIRLGERRNNGRKDRKRNILILLIIELRYIHFSNEIKYVKIKNKNNDTLKKREV